MATLPPQAASLAAPPKLLLVPATLALAEVSARLSPCNPATAACSAGRVRKV